MKTKLNLTTPEGRIVIDESEILAIAETQEPSLGCQIWAKGVEESFNIVDSYDEVQAMLA